MTEATEKWQVTIQKLMNKAEDSATSVAERDAIMSRVTYLMTKFGIEEAMLKAKNNEPENITSVRHTVGNPWAIQRGIILNSICKVFQCKAIKLNDDIIRVFGHESDHERVYMLYGSVIIQMFGAISAADSLRPKGMHRRTFNTSFVNGFTSVITDRIAAAYARAQSDVQTSTTGNGMELVLRNRTVAVNDAFRAEYPNVHYNKHSSKTSSSAGYNAGRSAGYRVNIGQTGLGGGRRELGS